MLIAIQQALVINAIQYTPELGKVTVILETDNRNAIIRVRDTGIGIPKIKQCRILKDFIALLAIALGILEVWVGIWRSLML